jgi:hypothetical protein
VAGNPDLSGVPTSDPPRAAPARVPTISFIDSDPFRELTFPNAVLAKLAIADFLGRPLARLSSEDLAWINGLLAETLHRETILARVRERFLTAAGGSSC